MDPRPKQVPSVGRIVHFTHRAGEDCRAAIVTAVRAGGAIDATVFATRGDVIGLGLPAGVYLAENVHEWDPSTGESFPDESRWHWPERVG